MNVVANYSTEFLVRVEGVSTEAKEWAEDELVSAVSFERRDLSWTMFISSNEVEGDVDVVTNFLQGFLQRFAPDGVLGFEWANTCSHYRVGAFGGGLAVVTAEKVETWDTAYFLSEKMGAAKLALDNQV